MNKIKDYNKSIYVDSQHIRNNKLTRRHSYDLKKSKIIEEDSNISHNKFKKLAKNKFRNIPKNQKLMNFSTILNNNENKNNNLNIPNINYLSIINDIYKNDSHLEHATNIKKKTNESNKASSLIPISKKRFSKSKQRTTNENNNLIINILKKEVKRNSHSKKNLIIYDDKCSKNTKISKHTKNSKNSKKKRKKRFNSSQQLIQIKNDEGSNISKQMENIRNNKVKNKKKNRNGENKKKEIDIEKIEDENKDEIIEKKNKKGDKEKQIICINNAKTKNENEVEKSLNKEKKKKYRRFPFCCLTMKDENSSDDN